MSAGPALASTRDELAALLAGARTGGRSVGLVPTMGALHEGHASLIRAARERIGDGPLVVSIFVNPLQFGAGEDLDRYPRTLEDDLDVCAREGVDIVFAPSVDEVYPGGPPQVTVRPGPVAKVLEGKTRPGHFRGVLTVVAKLFGLVRPDVAVFGQKDYQQLVLIRRMALDLNLGVEIVGAETVREDDGLALSSRNRYLDARPAGRRHRAQPGAAGGPGERVVRRRRRPRRGAGRAAHRARRQPRLPGDHRPGARRAPRLPGAGHRGPDPGRCPGRHHPPDRQPAAGPRWPAASRESS